MKKLWGIYFWIYCTFTIVVLFLNISSDVAKTTEGLPPIANAISYLMLLVPLLGLYGLAYKKNIFHHIFWKIYALFFLYSIAKGVLFSNPKYITIGLSTPFQLVASIGIFIYGYKGFSEKSIE